MDNDDNAMAGSWQTDGLLFHSESWTKITFLVLEVILEGYRENPTTVVRQLSTFNGYSITVFYQ